MNNNSSLPFIPVSGVYSFSASTSSSNTAVQILPLSGSGQPYQDYLIENTGSVIVYVKLAATQALANSITVPSVGVPGDAIPLMAGASIILPGPSTAWFNAQSASSTATILVCGGNGTLQGLASGGGGGGGSGTVTSVALYADLQAITPANAALAPTASAMGRTSSPDGSMGIFDWISGNQSANVAADPQKGIWVPPLSDLTGASGAWKRRYSDFLNVAWFGAKFDGATDDAAAFNAAFSLAAALGHCVVTAPTGATTKINSKISVLGSNITFDGCECLITDGITNGDPLFEVATSGSVFINFKNFSANGGTGHGISAIGAGGVVQVVRTENVKLNGRTSAIAKDFSGAAMPAYGLYAYGIYTLRVNDGYTQNGSGGIWCDSAQKIKVTGWNGDNLTDYGAYFSGCLGVVFSNQNTLTGAGGVGKSGIYVNGCESVTIDQNRIKGGGGTYAILTGDTLTRRLTVTNNDGEVYTPSWIKITTAVESFSVKKNLMKFIGGSGPFTDAILVTDKTGGGFLSFSGEITENDIQVGGSDTLTNGVNINVLINAARSLKIGNNTIGGGGVASVVTNGVNLQGNGSSIEVSKNAFAMNGGSVTNGVVVGAGHTSTKVEDNTANGVVTNLIVDNGTRTRTYESGAGNLTLTGCTTSPTGGYTYERNGRTVTLKILTVSGTSNTTAATLTGLPASIQPASNQWLYVPLFDNGAEVQGFAQVGASGTITLSKDIVSGSFTNTGTKGIRATAITWQL